MRHALKIDIAKIKKVHFVGIGGIGMSSLAQMLKGLFQMEVSGSDRALDSHGRIGIFQTLANAGMELFPQNGSFAKNSKPDAIVYSSAVEEDNPDFKAGVGILFVHRAEMLSLAINTLEDKKSIAVCGSAGKTTVTAWLAETLYRLDRKPLMIGGGISNCFATEKNVGNFFGGDGDFAVYEADESDKSLLEYFPEYAIITNLGTDHYPLDELISLFRIFVGQVKKAVVVSSDAYKLLGEKYFEHLKVYQCSDCGHEHSIASDSAARFSNYNSSPNGSYITLYSNGMNSHVNLPVPGIHSAWNFLSVYAACSLMLNFPQESVIQSASEFEGVVRRFNFKGKTKHGVAVYDDYAHNVDKLISCLKTSQELSRSGKVLMIFQPHGYGPLGFMHQPLLEQLEKVLRKDDVFAFLPVFYAGGTTSFSPTSKEICQDYRKKGKKNYEYFDTRDCSSEFINSYLKKDDIAVVCGARDDSLSTFAEKIT